MTLAINRHVRPADPWSPRDGIIIAATGRERAATITSGKVLSTVLRH